MADVQAERRGGGLSKLILWLLVLGLLVAVWWLASERNLRRFAWRPSDSVLTISKGRFFPLGMANIAPAARHPARATGPWRFPRAAKYFRRGLEVQRGRVGGFSVRVVPWGAGDAGKAGEKRRARG